MGELRKSRSRNAIADGNVIMSFRQYGGCASKFCLAIKSKRQDALKATYYALELSNEEAEAIVLYMARTLVRETCVGIDTNYPVTSSQALRLLADKLDTEPKPYKGTAQ